MADQPAALSVVLGPQLGPVAVADLPEAYPWPVDRRWVRAMMVTTLDGATAGSDGLSRSISAASDRAVFAAVRRLSDVVLIGASTFRAERYQPMRARPEDADRRRELGLAPAPVVAIVSGSLNLPWDEPIFTESAIRPLVVTTESADPMALAEAERHADLIALPGEGIQIARILDALEARGLRRVVCEGGATLLARLAADGLLDEADLSIAPLMTSGGQIATGPASAVPQRFSLVQIIAGEDGFLFTRYVKERSG